MKLILNLHPELFIARETHYFDDLRQKMKGKWRAPLSEFDSRQCEDYFLALAHRGYGRQGDPEQSLLDRRDLRAAALRAGEGSDGYFEAYCRLQAAREGKQRWGEKTPRHIFRIAEMLTLYPQAKIICMLRDPRAVVASYRRKGRGTDPNRWTDATLRTAMERARRRTNRSNDVLVTSLLWRSSVQAAIQAQQRFGPQRVHLQRFEDLVADPEATVRWLTRWLGVEFSPPMLDVGLRNSSFSAVDRNAGFAREVLARWRRTLTGGEIAVVQSACRSLMADQGYPREPLSLLSWLVIAGHWLRLPLTASRSTAANRARAARLAPYVWRRLRLVISG